MQETLGERLRKAGKGQGVPTPDPPSSEAKEKPWSVGGFAENVLDDAGEMLKGIGNAMLLGGPTAWKAAGEIYGHGAQGIGLLADNPKFLGEELWDTTKAVGNAVVEPYRKHGVGVVYHRPVGTLLDAMTIATLGGSALAKAGQLAKVPKLVNLGRALEALPARIGRGIGDKALGALGINAQERRLTLTAHREEMGRAQAMMAADDAAVGKKVAALSDADAALWHKARTQGMTKAEAAANPKVADALESYRTLVEETWQKELLDRKLLTAEEMETALAKKYAAEAFGKVDDAAVAEARAAIGRAEVKPVYGPSLFEKDRGFDLDTILDDLTSPPLKKEGKVGFLEKFTGAQGYVKDPRKYIPQAIKGFRDVESRLRYVERIMQDPRLATKAITGPGVAERLPTQGIFGRYFADQARAQAVYVRDLIAKHGSEKASAMLKDPAIVKELAGVRGVEVTPTVRRIVQLQFHKAGGPLGRFLRTVDAITNAFKRTATTLNPKWYIGNVVGDAVISVLAGNTFGNLRRARRLMQSLPPELRVTGSIKMLVGDEAMMGRFLSKFDSAGDFVHGIDQGVRAGIFDQAIAGQLKQAGASFYGSAEAFEEVVKGVYTAPEQLSDLQVGMQRAQEALARQSVTAQKFTRAIEQTSAKLVKREAALQALVSPETSIPMRERQIFEALSKLKEREQQILASRQVEAGATALARKDVRALAREGIPGVAKKLEKSLRQEQAASASFHRDVLTELKRTGIGPNEAGPDEAGMIADWRSRIPTFLRKENGRPLEEVAQELADRGVIGDASLDSLADFIEVASKTVREAKAIDRPGVRLQARQMVNTRSAEDVKALIQTTREQARLLNELRQIRSVGRQKETTAAGMVEARNAKIKAAEAEIESLKADLGRSIALKDQVVADLRSDAGVAESLAAQQPELSRKAEYARVGVERANAFLGDYLGLGPIEQAVFRRLVPFYPWSKAMTLLAFKLPFIAPKAGFLWNRYAAAMQTLAGDDELPEYMAGYFPALARENGDIVWARIAGFNPFTSVRRSKVGEVPIPAIAAFWEANPMLSVGFRMIGGKGEFNADRLPYGEPVVSIGDGSVFQFTEDGKIDRTIQQAPLISSIAHMFPAVQMVENLLTPFEISGHTWVGLPKPVLNPDGSYKYPRELTQMLLSPFISTRVRSREELIRGERMQVRKAVQGLKALYDRSGPEDREYIKETLGDYTRGEYRRMDSK